MAFDFKKEYKEFYLPKNKPEIVSVPKANYIAVRGKGNPNEEGGAYKTAIGVLYAVAYTLKMSYKTDYRIEGFYEYVVPPLEGFWWQEGILGVDYNAKETFNWISVIRLPEFVTEKDFKWAVDTASEKKKMDCSSAEFLTVEEGLCVQMMHLGPFDDEPASVALMDEFIAAKGYENDFESGRLHTMFKVKNLKSEYHRQGIGRQLFEKMLSDYQLQGIGMFTVNSSPYAVEVYRKLGFEPTDDECITNGIRYTPMKMEIS